jgi:DNA (cytosine-5)-methyltransferase 1
MNKINLLDLFSGIGGFHLGLEQAGFKFDWVGFSEIDKYASKQYKKRFPKSKELGDVTTIQPENLPKDIDILCGGFPCQAFSIAGKRQGFDDTRGTLFFEIARILRYFRDIGKPIPYFILENVKGLLNHDNGQTFATIYGVLTDLDYTVECQLLNTRWFLPQNRERIYLVGHIRGECRPKVFPIGENGCISDKPQREAQKQGEWVRSKNPQSANCISARYYKDGSENLIDTGLNQIGVIGKDSEATRVYDTTCARTIKDGGGMGSKTGLCEIKSVAIRGREHSPKGNLEVRKDNISNYLLGGDTTASMVEYKILDDYNNKINKTQYGKHQQDCYYDENGIMGTISPGTHGSGTHLTKTKIGNTIRRLTPTECERLQGFPDGWTEGQSDTQRYKQLGNAVSVPVVKAVGEKLIEALKGDE